VVSCAQEVATPITVIIASKNIFSFSFVFIINQTKLKKIMPKP
jgi:hypothetical protein